MGSFILGCNMGFAIFFAGLLAHITLCNFHDGYRNRWLRFKRKMQRRFRLGGMDRALQEALRKSEIRNWEFERRT